MGGVPPSLSRKNAAIDISLQPVSLMLTAEVQLTYLVIREARLEATTENSGIPTSP